MLSLDRWQEILDTMRRNKLRTTLTALSVAWGIFMLVVLLAAGTGLRNGTTERFRDDAINSIWIFGGQTSVPYKGHRPGRRLRFQTADLEAVRTLEGVEHLTGRYYLWGQSTVTYGDKYGSFDLVGCHPVHKELERTIITSGRYLNERDITERRKVAVIGKGVAERLFGTTDPLGEYIQVNNTAFRVVGTFDDDGREEELLRIFMPITTVQALQGSRPDVHNILFTVGNAGLEESKHIERAVLELMSRRHAFSPDDQRALRIRNNVENYARFAEIFDWLQYFVWLIGAGTVLAGIVGVSNIMLISVAERTVEFGIRKALGATPWSIIGTVTQEAIFVTALAGYLGLVAGVAVVEVVAPLVPKNEMFYQPQVNLTAVLAATGLLVLAGALAGFFPARRAAKVNPVVALRDE